jgi:hypothetical protein
LTQQLKFLHLLFEKAEQTVENQPTVEGPPITSTPVAKGTNEEILDAFLDTNRPKIEDLRSQIRQKAYALMKREEAKIMGELCQANFLQLQKIEEKCRALEDYEKHLFHENLVMKVT